MEYDTLQELIVQNLELAQVYQACTTKYKNNPLVANLCSYSGLAERAEYRLDIPENYFDLPRAILPRKISALNRYLELRSYSILDEFSLVKRNPDTGTLLGTYELWTAVQRAIEREDINALQKYLPLLSDEAHQILQDELSWGSLSKHAQHKLSVQFLQSYYSLESKEEGEESSVASRIRRGEEEALEEALADISEGKLTERYKNRLLLYSIESGRKDFFERTLSVLSGKSIYLSHTNFKDAIVTRDNIKIVYPRSKLNFLPPLDVDKRELIDAALYSGSASIVDYFRSYYRMEMVEPSQPYHASYEHAAYLSPWNKTRPVEFLSIVQRLAEHTDIEGAIKQGNTDVLIYILQTTPLSTNKIHRAIYSSLLNALGNIPLFIYLCTYLSENKVSKKNIYLLDSLLQIWEDERNSLLYPVSVGLIETYLKPELEFAFARREYKKLKADYLGSPGEEDSD